MAIKNSNNNHYSTPDTAQAAWLYSQGFELLDVETAGFPSIFLFENSSPKLMEAVCLFQRGEAEGNISTFFRAYKKLLRMIKGERP